MNRRNRFLPWIFCAVAASILSFSFYGAAQASPAPAKTPAAAAQAPSEADVANTQEELRKLLRLSPVLTSVVARDPSLLADQAYVARNNPELAQFLQANPDVVRNPEFYLFSHLSQGGHRDEALERVIWPDLAPQPDRYSGAAEVMNKIVPIIIVPVIFLAIVWIVRLFVESHRWNRAFKIQSDMQGRLIDKFGSSQDMAAFMESEAGKNFLLALPAAPGGEPAQRMPNAVARILTPLQAGIVLTLLGIGLLFLRNAGPDMETPMAVLGTLALTPGLGFILSAAVTWFLAKRLGLLPEKADLEGTVATGAGPQSRL